MNEPQRTAMTAAVEHMRSRLWDWQQASVISVEERLAAIERYHFWHLRPEAYERLSPLASDPAGRPDLQPFVALREREEFALLELEAMAEEGTLSRHAADDCLASTRQRLQDVDHRLTEVTRPAVKQPVVRREPKSVQQIVEGLLDPQTLRNLMMCGSGLLVLGLVLWMWSIGIFDHPMVAAACLGALNLAVIGVGVGVVQRTRYETAGRAITLLGCLVMPLNLWFYDAQGLIPLRDGGHLWIPALVCCLIYAGVARLLKDSVFVYALVGGVTMTGMLILADHQVERLLEILSPATLLVVLGLICIHTERLFGEEEGPFDRRTFGAAFFRSGHVLLASGVMLLFGARTVGTLHTLVFADFGLPLPGVTALIGQKVALLMLVMAAIYGYVYSYVVVRKATVFSWLAVALTLWCEWIVIDIFSISPSIELVTSVLAANAIVLNVFGLFRRDDGVDASSNKILVHPVSTLACVLSAVATALCLYVLGAEFIPSAAHVTNVWSVVAALVTTIAWGVGAFVSLRYRSVSVRQFNAYGLTWSGTVTAGVVALYVGATTVEQMLLVSMVVPSLALALVAGRGSAFCRALAKSAEHGALVLFVLAVTRYIPGFGTATVFTTANHLLMAVFFAAQAAVFGQAGGEQSEKTASQLLAAAAACACGWELVRVAGLTTYAPMVAASLVGIACHVVFRLRSENESDNERQADRWESIGNFCLMIGGMATILLAVNQVFSGSANLSLLGLLAVQSAVAVLAGVMQCEPEWRRSFFALGAIELICSLVVVHNLASLSFTDRVELFATTVGVWLLVVGHLGWYREQDTEDPLVSFNLNLGSLLASVPMVIGLVAYRVFEWDSNATYVVIHEVGVLAIGLALLAAGNLFRIRATTMAGIGTLSIYVLSLLALIQIPTRLQSVSIYMMIGGGTFFGIAVLLSIYRDRLLSMPDRIRGGEGMFQILKWR